MKSYLRIKGFFFDSAVICNFPHINFNTLTRFFKATTEFSSQGNTKKLMIAGERANNLKRLISCKLGITRQDDKLPKIVTITLESGGSAGIKLDLEENLKVFYQKRGWDWETGWPTKEKLEQLGI